ncbi:hypothetical protein [Marinovum sp.]|uniref:hypothetical protein n=1 Tax=Marinovum sp. TaxID=2024839 RepID=UPI003A8E6B23
MSRTYVLTLGVVMGIALALFADVQGGPAWAACILLGVMAVVLLSGLVTLAMRLLRREKPAPPAPPPEPAQDGETP